MGLVVVIPQDYEKLPEARRKRIVPICIAAYDHNGQLIAPDWFWRGVAPVHKQLVRMAGFMLGDPWCVSELAEAVVHKLWARYGSALGTAPQRRVLKKAMREAREINIGDWRKRKKPQFYLALATLDEKVREHVLADPHQWPALFEREILLDTYEERLGREGRAQMQQAFHLLRLGHNWDTIAVRVGERTRTTSNTGFTGGRKKWGARRFPWRFSSPGLIIIGDDARDAARTVEPPAGADPTASWRATPTRTGTDAHTAM